MEIKDQIRAFRALIKKGDLKMIDEEKEVRVHKGSRSKRLCELLGVEHGDIFSYPGTNKIYVVNAMGYIRECTWSTAYDPVTDSVLDDLSIDIHPSNDIIDDLCDLIRDPGDIVKYDESHKLDIKEQELIDTVGCEGVIFISRDTPNSCDSSDEENDSDYVDIWNVCPHRAPYGRLCCDYPNGYYWASLSIHHIAKFPAECFPSIEIGQCVIGYAYNKYRVGHPEEVTDKIPDGREEYLAELLNATLVRSDDRGWVHFGRYGELLPADLGYMKQRYFPSLSGNRAVMIVNTDKMEPKLVDEISTLQKIGARCITCRHEPNTSLHIDLWSSLPSSTGLNYDSSDFLGTMDARIFVNLLTWEYETFIIPKISHQEYKALNVRDRHHLLTRRQELILVDLNTIGATTSEDGETLELNCQPLGIENVPYLTASLKMAKVFPSLHKNDVITISYADDEGATISIQRPIEKGYSQYFYTVAPTRTTRAVKVSSGEV